MGTLRKVKGVHPLMDKGFGLYGIYVWGKFRYRIIPSNEEPNIFGFNARILSNDLLSTRESGYNHCLCVFATLKIS